MGISDEIDDTTIVIDETTILEMKGIEYFFQKSSFNIKIVLFEHDELI